MVKAILAFIVRSLFRINVVGEFKQEEERTVIIINHQSFLDGLVLGLILPISPVFGSLLKPIALCTAADT